MPSLKEYRNRIASVKSTRKITSAMKMVAASKLRRAQSQAESNQPYALRMNKMMARLLLNTDINSSSPVLIAGTGKDKVHLLLVVTSDRGLCGGFNAFIVRKTRLKINELTLQGKETKILCFGRKGHDVLKREFSDKIIHFFEKTEGRKNLEFSDALEVSEYILSMLSKGEFDICTILYNRFKNIMIQEPISQQIVPFEKEEDFEAEEGAGAKTIYEFEPSDEEVLEELLPLNLAVQIYRSLLDSAAGEQAARMTAMENATNNAGDMIADLTLTYNRVRQAYITKELIEIISGAEAV